MKEREVRPVVEVVDLGEAEAPVRRPFGLVLQPPGSMCGSTTITASPGEHRDHQLGGQRGQNGDVQGPDAGKEEAEEDLDDGVRETSSLDRRVG